MNLSQLKSAFKVSPLPSLVLHNNSQFTIAEVNQAYLEVANSTEAQLIGKSVWETLDENFKNGTIERVPDLSHSLEQVLVTKKPHEMTVQKYDVPIDGSDAFETKYCIPVNTPVLNEAGDIDLIIHSVTDITKRKLMQEQKVESERSLDKAYKLAHIGTWEYDMLSGKLHWSDVTKEVHGFGHEYEPDVESTIQLFKEGFNRKTFGRTANDAIEKEIPFDVELKIISGQGDERWIRATGEPEYKDGICVRFYGISQDVSGRRKAEENLQFNEQRFKALVQDGSDMMAILDEDSNYKYVSTTSETVLGIPSKLFIDTNAFDHIHEDDKERILKHLSELSVKKRIKIEPFRFADSQGNWRWIETTITNLMKDPAVGGLVANSRDVTKQKLQQQQIFDALKEKEILLAEIHHRVKNNLAVISGLLQLQAFDLEENNGGIADKLFDSVVRIKTISNIHEQLYQSNSFSKLEFAKNINQLVSGILKTFQSEKHINVDYQCEPLKLNIIQALPCSLIVNEIITNILKHAFQGRENGNILISLSEPAKKGQIVLAIKDSGIGLPQNFDVRNTDSLGLNLIDELSRQLKADYKFTSSDEGTLFTLQFEKEEPAGIETLFKMTE